MTAAAVRDEEEPFTSRLAGFHRLSRAARVEQLARLCGLSPRDVATLGAHGALPPARADGMIENVIGSFELPLGLALNFVVDGRDVIVPMAVEEPSIVAAASLAAKIVRAHGSFTTDVDEALMIGQVQVVDCPDLEGARRALLAARLEIVGRANALQPRMVARGGGARDVEVRVLAAQDGRAATLVLHLIVDALDAMGANLVNTMCEGIAPLVERLSGGRVGLRILSNLADLRLARARCAVPAHLLAVDGRPGPEVCEAIVAATRFAEADPYRAATHNKGVMNGIDGIAIATGNDWRAIEAGAHAHAARSGAYRPLTSWRFDGDLLHGSIELPLAVGTVGGPIRVHPLAQLCLRVLGVASARELAAVMAAAGLAQNLAALRALASAGIQRGHMALHARSVAMTAGADEGRVQEVADLMVASGDICVERARAVLATLRGDRRPARL